MKEALAACVLALLAAAGPARPQSPAPEKPAAQPPERPAQAKEAPLNLRLDNPARFVSRDEAPAEKQLPSLGATPQTSSRSFDSSSPYPKDKTPGY
jgi:hypothetical protein